MNRINYLKQSLFAVMTFVAAASAPATAADVGVSVSVGQPGFYGRVDIGDYPYPQPTLIYREPVIIHRSNVVYEPVYLHVPPRHAQRWRYYCGRYGACGQPVYFVQDRWYNQVYVPQYREWHGGHEWREHERHDRHWDHDRDHGRGYGHDRDHWHDRH